MAGPKLTRLPPPMRPREPTPSPLDRRLTAQGQWAGGVIAGTMLVWLGLQWLGMELGWDPRFAVLADLAALAAFLWALVVTFRIWRSRRKNQG